MIVIRNLPTGREFWYMLCMILVSAVMYGQSSIIELPSTSNKTSSSAFQVDMSFASSNGINELTIKEDRQKVSLPIQKRFLLADYAYLHEITESAMRSRMLDPQVANSISSRNGGYEISVGSFGNASSGFITSPTQLVEFASHADHIVKGNATIGETGELHNRECHPRGIGKKPQQKFVNYKSQLGTKIIEFVLVLDYDYVSQNGGKEMAIAKAISVISAMQLDFEDDFLYRFLFQISEIIISDCSSCDPWGGATNADALLHSVNDWVETQDFISHDQRVFFWTGRELDNDVIGSSFIGSLCESDQTTVLQDVSNTPWQLRMLASHELGHVLGSDHDAASSNTIMSAELQSNTTWSSVSIQSINALLATADCWPTTELVNCDSLTFLQTELSEEGVMVRMGKEAQQEIEILLYEGDQIIVDTSTLNDSIFIQFEVNSCADYRLVLENNCGNQIQTIQELLTNRIESGILISDAFPVDCFIDADSTFYNVQVTIENTKEVVVASQIWIGSISYNLSLLQGTNTYIFSRLYASSLKESIIIENSSGSCLTSFSFTAPGQDCSYAYEVDFNNCELPDGWITSAVGAASESFMWGASGSTRLLLNYGNSLNATSAKTIDGTCMALIDDDVVNQAAHSGITWLESGIQDLSEYDSAYISFDYIFDDFHEKGSNGSRLSLEVYHANTWTEIWQASSTTCEWYSIWMEDCSAQAVIDLTPYVHTEVKVRWVYTDGYSASWTGMAALDNVGIYAEKLLQNPCSNQDYVVDENNAMSDVSDVDMIYVRTGIDNPNMHLEAGQGVIFERGSQINIGSSVQVDIVPCQEDD